MADTPIRKPIVRRAAFVVGPARRRQFVEVLDYVDTQHLHIDPDVHRIDLHTLAALKRLFRDGEDDTDQAVCIAFTYDEILALSVLVEAADTCSHRENRPRVSDVTDQQLTELAAWVERSRQWFVIPLREA